MLSTKFANYMYIKDIVVNEAKTFVRGKATTSRKKTDYDKIDYNGYVLSNWNIRFSGKDTVAKALRLKKGDKIIVPQDGFSITGGELYAEGKFSQTVIQIWDFSMNNVGKASDENDVELPPEDDIPF